jgi:hypothetical protein
MRRFVLLEHRWDGVHWDLMLEDGPVLRTWAIDAPVVAGVELPARALADHRPLYLEYEGEVSGGRGVVRRLDRGPYEPLIWTPERVRVILRGSQLVGTAELRTVGSDSSPTPFAWSFRLGNFD